MHSAGGTGQPCNMGRMEVWNPHVQRPGAPQSGAWGSVCGQWTWNNNNAAKIFCRHLGFADGEIGQPRAVHSFACRPLYFRWTLVKRSGLPPENENEVTGHGQVRSIRSA